MRNAIDKVIFRTDANRKIGSGHLVRCQIIADYITRITDCKVQFIFGETPAYMADPLISAGYTVNFLECSGEKELLAMEDLLRHTTNCVLVIDGDAAHFYTKEYQLGVKRFVEKLVMITFYSEAHFYADIIHNQNIRAATLQYSCEPYTEKLLGPQYLVLKEEFALLADEVSLRPRNEPPQVVMITFGGTDEPNRTKTALLALEMVKFRPIRIIVVVGSLYAHFEELQILAKKAPIQVDLYRNTTEMPELMAQSDMALTSGGLTAWELGVLNVLNIIIPFSEREVQTAAYIDQNKYGYSLDWECHREAEKLAASLDQIVNDNYEQRVSSMRDLLNVNGTKALVSKILEVKE